MRNLISVIGWNCGTASEPKVQMPSLRRSIKMRPGAEAGRDRDPRVPTSSTLAAWHESSLACPSPDVHRNTVC